MSVLPVRSTGPEPAPAAPAPDRWLAAALLLVILVLGLSLRLVGLDWDEDHHLHPDERFLTMVSMDISAGQLAQQYFDTAASALNPNNRGYPFYVYGTLPLFLVRLAAERIGQTGYNQIHLVGRLFSALFDSATILIVFLIALRLFRSQVLALLAALFAALSVLPIQLAHYYTVDTFTNFFGMCVLYAACLFLPVGTAPQRAALGSPSWWRPALLEWRGVGLALLFGLALGLAAASKINAALLAVLLPGALLLNWLSMPQENRRGWLPVYLRHLFLAALVSIIIFRIFQPYAFQGPSFWNFSINQHWLDTLRSLTAQSRGDVDFPPALSWARRPITYAWTNMVLWGLGLPLGLMAWAGFVWMGWRIWKGEWRSSLLLWGWTGAYFLYQAISWVRAMRYQMLVYPTLAIIAAWACLRLWNLARGANAAGFYRVLARVVVVFVVVGTAAWAFAFTRIYTRPVTRVAASDWIYQNVPGAFNLKINTGAQSVSQPVAFLSGYSLQPQEPLVLAFRPQRPGALTGINFERLLNTAADPMLQAVRVTVRETPVGEPLAQALLNDSFPRENPNDGFDRGRAYTAVLDRTLTLDPQRSYVVVIELAGEQPLLVSSGWSLAYYSSAGFDSQPLPAPVSALRAGQQYALEFSAVQGGALQEVSLNRVVDWPGSADASTLRLSILSTTGGALSPLGQAEVQRTFLALNDPRGEEVTFRFAQPLALEQDERYMLRLEVLDGPGQIAVYGAKPANESSWDDALPVYRSGFNAYDYSYGIYRSDLNFEMYWDDNQAKRERFFSILDQADYIFISSNRQWGTTPRLPERYPLTAAYYRALLGCPADKDVVWCYRVAETGTFAGQLGFELQAVFQSDPNLGPLRFNTQFAEEAFTVYDHPKVLIFRKTAAYDPQRVRDVLNAVDLSTVVHLTPKQASSYPGNLLLPVDRLAQQQAGGTWSEIFNSAALYNRYPALAAALWYLVLALLGWLVYPLTRLALHGLHDRGFPFTRLVGLILLAYPVWLLGSARVPVTKLLISAVLLLLLAINVVLAYRQRITLRAELRQHWRAFLRVEVLILGFFLLFLLVRWGNPDLWHPWKGGEKPMDFSYFNAVLKSTTYPPYDPWFAGGYINYYYYGFVLAGVPVKWLGIVPSIAYNLILPSWFAMLAAGAYSLGWNLAAAVTRRRLPAQPQFGAEASQRAPLLGGLGAALGVAVLGNWGTVRMIWHGLQRLGDTQGAFEYANLLTRIGWAFQGLVRLFTQPGTRLPYGLGDWYWIPSRAIPGEPITEFPAFTFLYADLHAHLLALPVTLLALGWALSVLLGRWGWKGWGHLLGSFFVGGLAIATLRPTNTWDWPAFLGIGLLSVIYTALRYGQVCCFPWPAQIAQRWRRPIIAAFGALLLLVLVLGLYAPYNHWYGQAYTKIDLWSGGLTPFWSYMTHWGVFLFAIVSWMVAETASWLRRDDGSTRREWRWIALAVLFLIAALMVLLVRGVGIGIAALPLMVWAGLLLLRPDLPDAKRAVLLLTGAGLFLTVFVELAVLRGDIGRMNTVFKFYLQAWSLLGISAAAAVAWLVAEALPFWRERTATLWQVALTLLVGGAALFPILAGLDKVYDRMVVDAPHTLDGMTYMTQAQYPEGEILMDLSQDYRAIRWMQENVSGSPVIVEANVPEYRWGTRFTVYTGLPGVVGWNWHQRQQRALTDPQWVVERVNAVNAFYAADDAESTLAFLRRFDVQYIVVGQLEHAVTTPLGLAKFDAWNGDLWQEVYRDGQTVIYQVLP